ncbi:MAG TPA: RNA polymerase sigma factor [Hanamia sp.]|nr:RNA polymerase sigma factor [Hanamia sp.]
MFTNLSYSLEQTKQLIQSCIENDRNAQRNLYELYAPKMLGVCLRYAQNKEEAEEIMQEGFVQVFRSLHNFKFAGSFEGWIRKIMVFCAIAKYREKSKLGFALPETDNIPAINHEDPISKLGKKELLKMIQALPRAYRIVFSLYVFEGYKHREIAKELGISEGTSKSNLHDAKVILQRAVANSMKITGQKIMNG